MVSGIIWCGRVMVWYIQVAAAHWQVSGEVAIPLPRAP